MLAVERFCLDHQWIFAEVPGHADFGKDAYIDIVTDDGDITGWCFAAQIKGGRSRRRKDGYVIEGTNANRWQWYNSTMPVIGFVHDPETNWLYWTNITEQLAAEGADARIFVPGAQHLDGTPEFLRFRKHISGLTYRHSALLGLHDRSAEHQIAAVKASYAIGRVDPRALVALRRNMFDLEDMAFRQAVRALATAVGNPDLLITPDSAIGDSSQAALRPLLRWSDAEVRRLLCVVSPEGFDRGTLGQSVAILLGRDIDALPLVLSIAAEAAVAEEQDLASHALQLGIAWAGERGPSEFDDLVANTPLLGEVWAATGIAEQLRVNGRFTLY